MKERVLELNENEVEDIADAMMEEVHKFRKEKDQAETTPEDDPDEWLNYLAKNHLDLTESEFNKIAPDGMCDQLTLGDVENIRKKLSDGEKIKGVGPAFRQKLDDQMIEVITKFCKPVAEEPKSPPIDLSSLIAESEENPVERDEELVIEFIENLETLLASESFSFASDTLSGILEWVQENRVYTEKQRQSVYNIENSVEDET